MTPVLAAHGVVVVGSATVALDLDVAAGEVVGVVGPNGAGKSVTLAAVCGLLPLADGAIDLRGTRVDDGVTSVAPHRRGLGWAPQEPALLPRRRAARQVAPFVRPASPASRWSPDAVDAVLRAVGLDPADRRRPSQLSGGQRQRLSVARALVAGDVVLLDEPTSAQDAAGAAAIHLAVARHARDGGSAVLVAHRPEDVHGHVDRLVVVEDGRVVQSGTAHELALHPASPYVARLLGATVLVGVVRGGAFHAGEVSLVVADDAPDGPATVVIRPGAVLLSATRPEGSARNVVELRVAAVAHGPAGTRVALDGRLPLVAALTHAAAAALDLRPTMPVWAAIKANDVDVHPAATDGGPGPAG